MTPEENQDMTVISDSTDFVDEQKDKEELGQEEGGENPMRGKLPKQSITPRDTTNHCTVFHCHD